MSSSAIGTNMESMPGSVLENVLGGVLGSVQRSAFGSLVSSLLNAAGCIVSSAHDCMCIIVI